MKKFILALMLLLCVSLLWGCGEQTETAEAAPVTLYYNLDKGAQLTPDANGVYTVNFAVGNEKKAYTVTDEALLEQLLLLDFVGLQLDGDTVTGIIRMPDMPYYRVAWDCYVQSIGGNTVKLNILPSYAGKEVMLKLTEDLPIYDITPTAAQFGGVTQLQKNDCVSVIADESGALVFAYVTSRPAVPHEGMLHCRHCDAEVEWMDWVSTSSLPATAGHYLLQDDVTLARETRLTGGSICLDLNGKTITQANFGERIYNMSGACTLSILDSVGGGQMIPSSGDQTVTTRAGMCIMIKHEDAVFNLYGGTLDGTNTTAQTGGVVSASEGTFNMYDGTILGGTVYGTGSSAVTATDTFNMYGGRIVGGKHVNMDYLPLNPPGGGAIRVLGTTTIYGGIIEGGETYTEGGVIRLSPDAAEAGIVKLILKGGTITGGTAPKAGGIYAKAGTTVVISGDVKITGSENGNLLLEEGASITIGEEGLTEGAQIGISMETPGAFVTDAPEGVDLSQFFVSDDPAKKVTANGMLK